MLMESLPIEEMAREVYRVLGHGHRENVYQKALEVELRYRNIPYECERIVPITYKDHVISHMRMDLVIDGLAVVELKSVRSLKDCDESQIKRYLVYSDIQYGYLINFGTDGKLEVKEFKNPSISYV